MPIAGGIFLSFARLRPSLDLLEVDIELMQSFSHSLPSIAHSYTYIQRKVDEHRNAQIRADQYAKIKVGPRSVMLYKPDNLCHRHLAKQASLSSWTRRLDWLQASMSGGGDGRFRHLAF
jgi:hypothetical protein